MLTQPGELRLVNARRVLMASLQSWPCTKPELARRTGLSQMTIGKVVTQLLGLRLLEKVPSQTGPQHGRPPIHLRPSSRKSFVGLELGFRETTIYRLGLTGEPNPPQRRTVATPADLEASRRLWRAWRDEHPGPAECVLLTVPGVLDARGPTIVYSPNLHWTEGETLFEALAEDFGTRVCPVHEAQAQALGEIAIGEASDSFLLVDLTDSIGGTFVSEGHIVSGPLPLSGEIGHTAVPGNDRPCGCGAIGCIETLAGRGGLLQSFRHASGRPRASWEDMQQAITAAPLPNWLGDTLEALSTVVAGALNLLGFFEVVFIGDLAHLHPDVMPRLREGLQRHCLLARFGRIQARVSPSRRQVGLLAAAVERVLLPAPLG
ncbi:MAG: ROK family protein [Planctomycetes bacterium]|nr:ROK family protein [Planctomycetota bacterium]